MTEKNEINLELQHFQPHSLEELNHFEHSERSDFKYLVPVKNIQHILKKLNTHYTILEIDQKRLFSYQTTYFDTPGFQMYHDHQRGKLGRVKIRERDYLDTGTRYLEVKLKNNKMQTRKFRYKLTNHKPGHDPGTIKFINTHSPYQFQNLDNTFQIFFSRATLINPKEKTKLTIDFDLRYEGFRKTIQFPGLTLVEIKKPQPWSKNHMGALLKENKFFSKSFSKYCTGVSLLVPGIKKNRFKETIRMVAPFMIEQEKNDTNFGNNHFWESVDQHTRFPAPFVAPRV